MAYENLLTRERADLADTKEEYTAQMKVAEDWFQKALATKKRKAEQKAKTSGAASPPNNRSSGNRAPRSVKKSPASGQWAS